MVEVSGEVLFRAASQRYRALATLPWASCAVLGTGRTPARAEAELKSDCSLNYTVIGLERNHVIFRV